MEYTSAIVKFQRAVSGLSLEQHYFLRGIYKTSQFIGHLGSSQEARCLSKIIQNELCGCCITFKLCKVKKRAMKPWQQVIAGAAVLTKN